MEVVEQHGLITINAGERKIQLILRRFHTIHALLTGFDLGAASVATNLHEIWTTARGAWCLAHRTEIVHPPYSSVSYETRLCKYFNEKGFALALPNLAQFSTGERISILNLSITIAKSYKTLGIADITDNDEWLFKQSDYDTSEDVERIKGRYEDENPGEHPYLDRISIINYFNFIRGDNNFIRKFYIPPVSAFTALNLSLLDYRERQVNHFITLRNFETLFRSTRFTNFIFNDEYGTISPSNIKKMLHATDAELMCVCTELSENVARYHQFKSPTVQMLLKRTEERCRRALAESSTTPVRYVIVDDPSRQFTASLNPIIRNPVDWYGAHYDSCPPPCDVDVLTFVKNFVDSMDVCPICYTYISNGDLNVCRTICGHVYHLSGDAENECQGLFNWLFKHSDSCPICRKKLLI
jgi:hypothetical protein